MADSKECIDKLLDYLSNKPVSVHQIVCTTKLHTRTVKKYLDIIEKIQNSEKIKKEVKGCRVFYSKEI